MREMGLEACVFQVIDSKGTVRGTGFAISPNLVVTCAHIVKNCNAKIGEFLNLFFYPERVELKAELLRIGWEEDVAFLRLDSSLPNSAIHMGERLGSFGSKSEIGRHFLAFGYPKIESDVKGFFAQGLIIGKIQNGHGAFQLQLESQEITFGVSGAPVMDDESGLIVGMVQKTQIPDATEKFRDLAYALPTEDLCNLSPDKLIINEVAEYNQLVEQVDVNKLITAFSTAHFFPLHRFDPKTPLEMIKQNLVGDKVLPIMAELTRINNIDDQIKYVREQNYAEIYKDSWAEHELQLIGLHVLDILDLKKKLDLKNKDVGSKNIYDAGCANCGQFISLMAYLKRAEINQKRLFKYFAQDFNPDWENKFKVNDGRFILKPLPLIDESMKNLCDIICCTHALHYLGNTPLAIYSSFFSFNYLLKRNGYCYVTVPEKTSLPGILDLLEKSAKDTGFTIIESGKRRLIHTLTEEPHNITTFFFLIIQKTTDGIDQEKWKKLIGSSFYALKNTEISNKYGIHDFGDIDPDIRKLKKELSNIIKVKDRYVRVFRYALDAVQNNWEGNTPNVRVCSENIKDHILKIHRLMTGNIEQNIRRDKLQKECASYFYWLVGFFISYNNSEVNQEHIDLLKSTLDSNKDIRVDINNLDDEQVSRLIKHLFEICQYETIDILSAFDSLVSS